jgi:hypothetical protein
MSRLGYFIFGSINKKVCCLGPFRSDNEAQSAANKITDWDGGCAEVEKWMTTDIARAKQMHKAKMAQSSGQLGMSLQPIRNMNSKKTSRLDQIKESRGIE